MKPIELKLDTERLVVSNGFTTTQIRTLVRDLEECREEYLESVSKSVDKVVEVNTEFAPQLDKKDNESDEDYKARLDVLQKERKEKVLKVVGEDGLDSLFPLALLVLAKIATVVGQSSKVTKERVESTAWVDVKEFIFKVLSYNDIPFSDVFRSRVDSD